MSRSRGMKSWSISRSTPTAANRRTTSRASSGVPSTQRGRRVANHASDSSSAPPKAAIRSRFAALDLVPVPADQHPGHHRVDEGGRLAPGGAARVVELRELDRGAVGAGRGQVELVRVAGRDPERARRPLPAHEEVRVAAVPPGEDARLGPEQRILHGMVLAGERPAVRLVPQPMDDLQRLLQHLRALADLREREPVAAVLILVPAGAETQLDAPAAQLVRRDHDLGQVAGGPERDRRHQHAEADPLRVPREARDHGPCVGGVTTRVAREALVVVGPEQGLETGRLRAPGDGQLVRRR